MFVCPKCGHALKVRELNDYSVDPETGESNNSIGDYGLTDVLVICTVCGADVTDYFTNEQDELDIDGGVWKLKAQANQNDLDLACPHCQRNDQLVVRCVLECPIDPEQSKAPRLPDTEPWEEVWCNACNKSCGKDLRVTKYGVADYEVGQ